MGQPASPTPLLLSVLSPVCIPCPMGFCVEFETDPQTSSGTVVQQLSHVRFLATPWTAACQASCPPLSAGVCSVSMESVMLSNHLVLCRPLLLLPSTFPSIGFFSNKEYLQSNLGLHWPAERDLKAVWAWHRSHD